MKIASLLLLLTLSSASLFAQSPAVLFADFDPNSDLSVDHGPWARLLDLYLNDDHPSGIHLFDYAGMSADDRREVDDYLAALESVDPLRLNRDEQMAYWINFYNALTVKVVLDHYPVDSIRDISLPGSRRGPWKAKLVTVNGQSLSLDDMEHGILRPLWQDPRIHYALNCASLGCPNLAPRPYDVENLDAMLDAAARDYINHPRGVSPDGPRLILSSIYQWYASDFGGRRGLAEHLLRYADDDAASAIGSADGRYRYDYDWSLNSDR